MHTMNANSKKRQLTDVTNNVKDCIDEKEHLRAQLMEAQQKIQELENSEIKLRQEISKFNKANKKVKETWNKISQFVSDCEPKETESCRETINECENGCSWSDASEYAVAYCETIEAAAEIELSKNAELMTELVQDM